MPVWKNPALVDSSQRETCRDHAMTGPLTNNGALIQEVIRLVEDAAKFHGKMAGSAVFPESFIRDWVERRSAISRR